MSDKELVTEPEDPSVVLDKVRLRDRRRVITPVFLALIIALIMSAVSNISLAFIANDTNKVVGYIDNQTSPERQRAQTESLNKILLIVDCNVRYALQEAFDQLEEQGLLAPDSVTITDNCRETTSTTLEE